jgi:hypothetical protein
MRRHQFIPLLGFKVLALADEVIELRQHVAHLIRLTPIPPRNETTFQEKANSNRTSGL